MKFFLKIVLVLALLLIAIKLSPLIFVATLIGLVMAAVLGAAGLSLLAIFCAIVAGILAVLAPIWIPVLIIMGAISLFRKPARQSPPPTTAA